MPAESGSADAQSNEETIGGWFTAFNHRDLDGMLARFDPAIEFRPLRFPGVDHIYEGHEGVRSWFEAVMGGNHVHRIDADEFRDMDDGRILVSGSVSLASVGGIAPFSGIYALEASLIRQASHYFTPSTVLDRLGIIE
ncbi:MAG: nuclear transport factor 2 family protein [Solirubrobacterales bacterium]